MAEKEKPSTRRDARKDAMDLRFLSAARPKDLFPAAPISGLVSAGIQAPTLIPANHSTFASDANDTPGRASEVARLRSPRLKTPARDSIALGGSIDPTIDLNNLKPQFQDIVLPPIVPKPPSSVDPSVLLNQALQRSAQQAEMDVDLRKQQQLEQGVGGEYGDGTYFPKDSSAVADYLNKNIPQDRLSDVGHINAGNVFTTKVVPGIGHVTDIIPAESGFDGRVMTGRYGTGSATFSDKPRTTGGTITENGKKVPIAGWFNDAARRQGESNQFFNKAGRKIVPDKVA
jgi:hypothetical protein